MNLHSGVTPEAERERFPTGTQRLMPALEGKLDLQRWIAAVRRRIRLLSAVALAVFVATALVTLTATPKYTAVATVMLDPRQQRVTSAQEVLAGLPADSSVVDTEVEVLKSRQLAERVVASLKLEEDPEFNPALREPRGLGSVASGIAGLLRKSSARSNQLTPVQAQKRHERIVDAVLSDLTVKRAGLTYIINVGFQSQQPAKAARIANKFAELYLLEQLQAKFDATQQATTWLNGQLDQLRQQVLRDEAAVQQYKIDNNLLSASGTTLTEQEISSYSQNLAQARAQLAEDEARLGAARIQLGKAANGGDVGEALNSTLIQGLRTQRAQLTAQMADLQGRYGDRHPEMLKAKRQLADIDSQIQQELRTIIANLEAKVQVSRERANAMGGSLSGAKGTLAVNNRAMVRLNELQRNADASRTIYESYLNRYKETSTQEGIETSDARVVSKAKIPTHQSSPKVPLNLALGLLFALGAGAGSVVLAELLDAGLATAEDVERRLDSTYLGSVPLLSSVAEEAEMSPADYVVAKPLSSFSEAFRSLRTSILYSRLGEPVKVVAVTSALPGEGKTTTSICLGRASALQGARTIVIDCDLRRRTVNRFLGTEPEAGLLEVLSGEATLQQAVLLDEASGAHFLAVSQSSFTPKDVFGTSAMDRLLEDLRKRYDMIILDTAPVLPVADTRVLAPKADALVFLARWRKTPQQAIEAAFRLLQGSGAHIAGVALTQVDMKAQTRYGYGDPGYYYAEYKKYYVS